MEDDWMYQEERNMYGGRIVRPEYFEGMHYPAIVPMGAGEPPVCSCGWTRWRDENGTYFELYDHIRDMGDFGTMERP